MTALCNTKHRIAQSGSASHMSIHNQDNIHETSRGNNPNIPCNECTLRCLHSFAFVRGENLTRQHKQRHVGVHMLLCITDTKVRGGQPPKTLSCQLNTSLGSGVLKEHNHADILQLEKETKSN